MSPEQRQPEPEAAGRLATTPFVHVLLYLDAQSASGTLVVGRDEAQVRLKIEDGQAVAALTRANHQSLEQVLVMLAGLDDAPYAFYTDDLVSPYQEHILRGQADAYTVVTAACRAVVPDAIVERLLANYEGTPLKLEPGKRLSRLSLNGSEQRVVALLRASPLDLLGLEQQSGLGRDAVRRLAYLLLITKVVTPFAGRSATGTSQTRMRAVAAPRRRQSTPMPSPRGDRGSNPSMAPPPAWQQLGARMRSQQPGPKASHSSSPGAQAAPTDATSKYRRAQQHCDSQRYDDALTLVEELLSDAPEDPDYLALKAWVLWHRTPRSEAPPEAMDDTLRKVFRIDPEQPRGLFLRALLMRRAGKEKEALRFFRRILLVEPRLLRNEGGLRVAAERELRVARIRRRSDKS